jgi:hypothetical protein
MQAVMTGAFGRRSPQAERALDRLEEFTLFFRKSAGSARIQGAIDKMRRL